MTGLKSATFLILIVSLSFILPSSAAVPSVYRVYVDGTDGFYHVRNIEPGNIPFQYVNNTLNINAGDSIIWENQDYYDWPLTIVSEQNLWDNKSGHLRYSYARINHTFMQPGTYGVYIKEYPRVPHQTIIVAAVETPTVTAPPPTPTETETAAPTASAAQTPPEALPGFNPWYIVLAFIVVAGLVVFIYSLRKK